MRNRKTWLALLLALCFVLGVTACGGETDTPRETDGSSVTETRMETADETMDETVNETADETVDETSDETVGETVDETADETMDENADETANETEHVHTEVIDARVEPTCTVGGRTEGSHCSECGEITIAQESIPATGVHIYGTDNLCTGCGVAKPEPTEGLAYTLNSDGVSYSASGIGTATATEIVIADTFDGLPVTSIGDYAFYDCRDLTSIIIPEGVTSIGDYAFSLCRSMVSVIIPDSVTSIGNGALSQCELLKKIAIPNSVTSIGDGAFWGDGSLTSISIPDGVTSIGNVVFGVCTRLESVTIPNSVTSIGDSAFEFCYALTDVILPDGLTYIGESAFCACHSLTDVTIPRHVRYIGEYAFSDCGSVTSITVDAENVSYHASGNCLIQTADRLLIAGCGKSVIPTDGSVTAIGDSAFEGCDSLKSILIPDGLTSIGESAFYGCHNLTDITISKHVRYIGEYAFSDCGSVTSITVDAENVNYHASGNCLIQTADRLLIAGCGNSVIPTDGSVTAIGDFAFYACHNLTDITIPGSVTEIGGWGFGECSLLTDITYAGTIAEWAEINKSEEWDAETASYTIHCTDGDITK